MKKNAFYAQSGGVTSVINATAAAVIQEAKKFPNQINKVYAGQNGILGALRENLIDTSKNAKEYKRLIEVFKAHDIGYFFYNGGNDSADTAYKVSQISKSLGYNLTCIAIPKTVDNDLAVTDTCPGFGSVAKYVAISTQEASLDVQSMMESSTKVFILEVMGRHAGWIAGSSALAKQDNSDAPHIILLPEITFNQTAFLKKVKETVNKLGYCVVVASEGIKNNKNKFLAEANTKDAFGHAQLGGVAPFLANLISQRLKLKNHWAVADYLQRSARHISSKVDLEHAEAVGRYAIKYAVKGMNGVMPVIKRKKTSRYSWEIVPAKLSKIANVEKKLPKSFITKDGFGITKKGIDYFSPLIQGEGPVDYKNGLPKLEKPKLILAKKKLPNWK